MRKKEHDPEIFKKIDELFKIREKITEAMICEAQARDKGKHKEEKKYCMIREDLQTVAHSLTYMLEKAGVENVAHRIDNPGVKFQRYAIPLNMEGLDVNAFTVAAAAIESLIETDIKILKADVNSPTKQKALENMNIVKQWYAMSRSRIMHTMNALNESALAQQRIKEERNKNGGGHKT